MCKCHPPQSDCNGVITGRTQECHFKHLRWFYTYTSLCIDLASPLSPIFVYPESFSPSLPAYFNKNPQLNLFLADSLTLATLSSFNHDATIHCLRKTSSHPSVLKILCCLYFLYENSTMAPWSSCDGDLVHRYWCYWEEVGNWRRCGLVGLLCPWRYTLQVNVGTLSSQHVSVSFSLCFLDAVPWAASSECVPHWDFLSDHRLLRPLVCFPFWLCWCNQPSFRHYVPHFPRITSP